MANDYFKSYLSNRNQYVCLEDRSSEMLPVTHGVPQGSILGPILFLIFINDFPDSSNFFKFTLFADDSNLICKFKYLPPHQIHDSIQSNLIPVFNWLQLNKIKVNVSKCKFMIFSYGRSTQIDSLNFGGGQIEETDHYKFLGIFLDNRLTFKPVFDRIGKYTGTGSGTGFTILTGTGIRNRTEPDSQKNLGFFSKKFSNFFFFRC